MISRRAALTLLPASLALAGATPAQSQTAQEVPMLPGLIGPGDDPEFGPRITGTPAVGGAQVGTGLSRHDDVRTAFRILLDAPQGAPLLSVARYFKNLKQKNADGELFSAEWKDRANPLITGMFGVTGTSPSMGDQTSWCAAFVSTCLYIAYMPNAYTALSGGYRKFGTDVTSNPREADLAVFSKYGEEGTKGFGHIGIFVRKEARNGVEGVMVLGGNQGGQTGTTGAVTESWHAAEAKDLYLHSIRRAPGV